jgi:allantoinase
MEFRASRIPYENRKGASLWPGKARMAVLVYTAVEQWEWGTDGPLRPQGTYSSTRGAAPTLSTESAVDYGFNVGLPRLREIYREFGMKVTLWTNANAIERFPSIVGGLVEDGHELGAHGYSESATMGALAPLEREESVRRSISTIESFTGKRPRGWLGPGAEVTPDLLELLAKLDFDYHGDLQDDELPYFLHVGDATMVEIPYRMAGNVNDLPVLIRNPRPVRDAIEYLTQAFDAYYAAAATHPLIFNLGTHPYVSGRPEGARIFRSVLEHIHSHSDVWVTNYGEMATWWREQFGGLVPNGGGDILAPIPRTTTIA